MIAAFRRGVRFECTRCGECCTRLRANLPLTSTDVRRISAHLGLTIRSFVETYGVHAVDRVHLRGTTLDIPSIELRVPANGTCVFLDAERRCTIHEVKPAVCERTPFVGYVAEGGATAWNEAVSYCPGIGIGPRYSPARIRRQLREEAASDEAEIDLIIRNGSDLDRVLQARLPAPQVRETTIEEGDLHGIASPPAAAPTAHGQALDRPARRRSQGLAAPRDLREDAF